MAKKTSSFKSLKKPMQVIRRKKHPVVGIGKIEKTPPVVRETRKLGTQKLDAGTIIDHRMSSIYLSLHRCKSHASIVILNGIMTISNNAFDECKSLTSICIPNGITTIDNYAFRDCESLTSIMLPDTVTTCLWQLCLLWMHIPCID
jgi:hypothetical protein